MQINGRLETSLSSETPLTFENTAASGVVGSIAREGHRVIYTPAETLSFVNSILPSNFGKIELGENSVVEYTPPDLSYKLNKPVAIIPSQTEYFVNVPMLTGHVLTSKNDDGSETEWSGAITCSSLNGIVLNSTGLNLIPPTGNTRTFIRPIRDAVPPPPLTGVGLEQIPFELLYYDAVTAELIRSGGAITGSALNIGTGSITCGAITGSSLNVTGAITGTSLNGNGSNITSLNAVNLSGNINIARIPDVSSKVPWLTNELWAAYNSSTLYSNWSNGYRFTGGGHMGRSTFIKSGQDGGEWTQIELQNTHIVINADSWAQASRTTTINLFADQIYSKGAFLHYSDDRLKHNEIIINNGLDVIRQLSPQKYQKTKIKLDADYNGDLSGIKWHWETGFIAQDVLQIEDLSYCVNHDNSINADGEATDVYSLNYNDIFVYNVGATQELDVKVTLLEGKNIFLEQENLRMKTALNILLVAAGQNTI